MHLYDIDLVPVIRLQKLNMDPDYKRNLISPDPEHRGSEPFLQSNPHKNVEAFLKHRKLFDQWRTKGGNVLKTRQDWDNWQDYQRGQTASMAGVKRGKDGVLGQARRIFLRAYVRGLWGLPGGSYAEVAAWLTGHGHPTSINDLKNAKRVKTEPPRNVVPGSAPGVAELVATIMQRYPSFDVEAFIDPDDPLPGRPKTV